jgi:hypothetical protein
MPRLFPGDVSAQVVPAVGAIQGSFVADMLAPAVAVGGEVGKLQHTARSGWFRNEVLAIADGHAAPKTAFAVATTPYCVEQHAIACGLSQRTVRNADWDALATSRAWVKNQLLLDRELRAAAVIQATANWPNSAVTTAWSLVGCTPLTDMQALLNTVEDAAGQRPNRLMIPALAWRELEVGTGDGCSEVRALIAGNLSVPPEVTLGNYLRTTVVIGSASYTEVAEGGAAESAMTYTPVWAEDSLWCGVVPEGDPRELPPGACVTARVAPMMIERLIYADGSAGEVRGSLLEQILVLNTHCGRLLTGLL